MMHFNKQTRYIARGFTLVEVMVALIIISIGMLGIAKMQGLALSSTNASRSRALAAIEASSLASAMQANRAYWSSATSLPGAIVVTTAAGGNATITAGSGALQTAIGNAGGVGCGVVAKLSCYCTTGQAAPCTTATTNLAANDLYDWAQTLASFLPNATATVNCIDTDTPVDCTIQISWNENAVALTTQQANTSVTTGVSTVAVSYTLYVVP